MQPDTIFSVVKKCFGELSDPLKFIFDLSLEKRIFPDDLKITRFNPVFIGRGCSKLGNCRPISVLLCLQYLSVLSIIAFTNTFQKTKVLTKNNLLFKMAIQLTSQLFNLTIKYLKLLKIICIGRTCLLTFKKSFKQQIT